MRRKNPYSFLPVEFRIERNDVAAPATITAKPESLGSISMPTRLPPTNENTYKKTEESDLPRAVQRRSLREPFFR